MTWVGGVSLSKQPLSSCGVSRLEDVGLEKFSVPVLFTKIFIPAAFLLVPHPDPHPDPHPSPHHSPSPFTLSQHSHPNPHPSTFTLNLTPTLTLHPLPTCSTSQAPLMCVCLQVCIIHLHYFHQPFLELTDLKTVVETHNSTITR